MTPSCLEYITHQKTFLVRKDGRESPLLLVHQLSRQLGYFTGLFRHALSRKLSCMIYWLRLSFPQLTPSVQFSSVAQSFVTLYNNMDCSTPGIPVYHPAPRACSNSCPSSRWCHPTSSSSVIPFSSCLQSFPSSGSFPMSQFFASGGQSIGASASVFPMNIQGWFLLGLTGWSPCCPRDCQESSLAL